MTTTRTVVIGLAAALCFVPGCAQKSVSDESLVSAVQSKLAADDATKAANIKVDAKAGVITLSGDVPSSDVELEAMKMANATTGVARVDDQLKVNAAASTPPASTAPASTPAAATSAPAAAAAPPPAAPPAPSEPAPAAVAESTPPAAPVRRERPPLTVPAGTRLQVRTIDAIDSRQNSVGQTFNATLDSPLVVGNRVVDPAGAPVTIALTNARSAGRIKGSSQLSVRVTSLTANGRSYEIDSDVYDEVSKGKGKQTAVRSGIGAAAGALIGGLAGGGKGAAIGAGAGAGAGLGYQFFTHGNQVKIPSESVLTFRLASPLTVSR
jgi:hypothetical protein